MAHVIWTHLGNTSGTVTVNNGTSPPVLEVFLAGTYAVGAGTDATTLVVPDGSLFTSGDTVYIDDNAATVTSGVSGNNITVPSQSWSDGDTVIIKRLNGVGTDHLATIYDDPLMAGGSSNTITQTGSAFTADANNQWEFHIEPGLYHLRVSDASDNTLKMYYNIQLGPSYEQINPDGASPTQGISEALVRTGTDGGTVELSAGTFTMGAQATTSTGNIVLRGQGAGQTIIKMDASSTFNMLLFTGDNITIEGITFDGNGATNANTNALLVFTDNSNITVRDCVFQNANQHQLWFNYSSTGGENISVQNCEFTNWDIGGAGGDALRAEQDWKFIRVSNCYFHDAATASGNAITVGSTTSGKGPCQDVAITNCNFENVGPLDGTTTARGISFGSPIGSRAEGLVVSNNTFRSMEGDCISLTNADHISITGNNLNDFEEAGMFLNGCRWASIVGNVLQNDNGITPDSASGISFGWTVSTTTDVASSDIAVVGNTLYNMDPSDASGQGSISCSASNDSSGKTGARFLVANNVIYTETKVMAQYGVWFTRHANATLQDVTIMGNYIEHAQEEGIRLVGVTGPRVFNNVVVDSGVDPIELTQTTASTAVKLGNNDFGSGTTGDCSGQVTLVAGAATVTTKAAHTGMKVMFTPSTAGGTQGIITLGAISNGVNFAVASSSGSDTSVVDWMIVE